MPPCPRPKAGAHEMLCPYYCVPIDAAEFDDSRWRYVDPYHTCNSLTDRFQEARAERHKLLHVLVREL
jgi:hypothetical protein